MGSLRSHASPDGPFGWGAAFTLCSAFPGTARRDEFQKSVTFSPTPAERYLRRTRRDGAGSRVLSVGGGTRYRDGFTELSRVRVAHAWRHCLQARKADRGPRAL